MHCTSEIHGRMLFKKLPKCFLASELLKRQGFSLERAVRLPDLRNTKNQIATPWPF